MQKIRTTRTTSKFKVKQKLQVNLHHTSRRFAALSAVLKLKEENMVGDGDCTEDFLTLSKGIQVSGRLSHRQQIFTYRIKRKHRRLILGQIDVCAVRRLRSEHNV